MNGGKDEEMAKESVYRESEGRRRITEDDWQESDWLKDEQRNLHIEDEWREGKKLMIDYAKESMYKGNDQRENHM